MGHLNQVSKQIVILHEVGGKQSKHSLQRARLGHVHYGNAALGSDLVLGFTGDLELQY